MQFTIFVLDDTTFKDTLQYFNYEIEEIEPTITNVYALFEKFLQQNSLKARRFNVLLGDKVFYFSKRFSGNKKFFKVYPMEISVNANE